MSLSMTHSSAKSPEDMSSPDESKSEWTEQLDLQIPADAAKIELDEEDQNDLNAEAWFLVGKLLDFRMKKELRAQLLHLHARLEETLGWYKRN
jgi:hypothetical protein